MTVSLNSPDLAKAISILSRRVDVLERRRKPAFDQFRPTVDYSYSGAVTTAGSPNYSFELPEVAYNLVLHLTTAGSSATVVELHRNGVMAASATLDSGIDKVVVPLSIEYAGQDQDVLRLVTTTAGTGAVDLTVIVRLRLAPAKPIA